MYNKRIIIRSFHNLIVFLLLIVVLTVKPWQKAYGQPELMAWGNLTGIRVEGQLMKFESSIRIVGKGWKSFSMTAMEKQHPKYERYGQRQIVTTAIDSMRLIETIEDKGNGIINLNVNTIADRDTSIEGIFLCFDLPEKNYSDATIKVFGGKTLAAKNIEEREDGKPIKMSTNKVVVESAERQLSIIFKNKARIFLRKEIVGSSNIQLYIELMGAKVKKGQKSERNFTVKASGEIDNSPVNIKLNVKNPGRKFAGLGGNFRLQNPKSDPQVIQYCMDNLRVAWGRVEMPWNFWHPEENADPMAAAEAGNLDPHVRAAMEMAQRLTKKGIPIVVTDWSAPAWAIVGDPRDAYRFRSQGIYGYQLNKGKMDKIYKSIGDYLVYLKQNYGVEASLFSFNESDLGINIRHTGEEHASFIKKMGAYLASRGLATKMLLGDNSDATTYDFIYPAMNDPETYPYIGAISFHSWRGCTTEILQKWANAAKKMNIPLMVGEGSTDAAAWQYPQIFEEESFALNEINLYIRLCSVCQPISILQWQLTSDYSILVGDGIYNTVGKLRPTQRFWNLKQLSKTPENSFSIPFTCNKEDINCAVFGNIAKGEYAIHVVNNGAECDATISGIPSGITVFDVYITDAKTNMKKTASIPVENGQVKLMLHPASFMSLFSPCLSD